jgi:hypothetical protein
MVELADRLRVGLRKAAEHLLDRLGRERRARLVGLGSRWHF